jgi:hypothetical protein
MGCVLMGYIGLLGYVCGLARPMRINMHSRVSHQSKEPILSISTFSLSSSTSISSFAHLWRENTHHKIKESQFSTLKHGITKETERWISLKYLAIDCKIPLLWSQINHRAVQMCWAAFIITQITCNYNDLAPMHHKWSRILKGITNNPTEPQTICKCKHIWCKIVRWFK